MASSDLSMILPRVLIVSRRTVRKNKFVDFVDSEDFDYPGYALAYQEFVKAVIAYKKKLNGSAHIAKGLKFDQGLKKKRKSMVRSFLIAKNIHSMGNGKDSAQDSELEAGAEFLKANITLSLQKQNRLNQMGVTVRNASAYIDRFKMKTDRERIVRAIIGKMSIEQLSDMVSFYHKMRQLCSETLERKIEDLNNRVLQKMI